MKAKELAGYLLENPDWEVEFWFNQMVDEIEKDHARAFSVTDIGDNVGRGVAVLIGEEAEKCSGLLH
jgi:hypothetical protein